MQRYRACGPIDMLVTSLSELVRAETYLSNCKQLGSVSKLPVTQFVAKDSNNLFRLALLHKSVIDHNVLLPGESKEVGIAMGASLTTINGVNVVQGEFELLSEFFNTSLDGARLQRGEFVEHRQDDNRVNRNGEHLNDDAKHPKVVEEFVTSLLDDLEYGSHDGTTKSNTKSLALQHVCNPQPNSLLVETELFLKDESAVVRDRER